MSRQQSTPPQVIETLRAARKAAGFSQAAIGKMLGISPQQYSKYETGANELKSSTLLMLARTLDLGPADLGWTEPRGGQAVTFRPELRELATAWQRVKSDRVRKELLAAITAIAEEAEALGPLNSDGIVAAAE
ncbi:helix-turn-helix domain-containing protein [Tianweitania sediminis]|uniref:Helix-turn-helix transcriptional regulator n=1 Tax=Tianweitania sediminis TaxID=1502156 RepID=A0A8J7UKN2_9HYPH|nr:helix-turn-helix transcriptional regulator [Tianweitania sediminis]MBP0441348.1 helix-turn-helix transcriptional regulator [Tianweitania sediminis]